MAAFASALVGSLVLVVALVRHDFSLVYVARLTSEELPLGYTLSAFWGGQEGSLLLWVLMLTVWMVAVSVFSRRLVQASTVRATGTVTARGGRW